MSKLENVLISPDESIRKAIEYIDRNTHGIVLVVDGEGKLIGTITDGDIRRAILDGTLLDKPVSTLLESKRRSRYTSPVTAPAGTEPMALIEMMRERRVQQLPLVDSQGWVTDLVTLKELVTEETLPLDAVIMAGGRGTRLRPLTDETPKPMLPVGGRPLMEHLLEGLRASGIQHVQVATHYKRDVIEGYFGDGHELGIDISYVAENRPLGTAGALGLLEAPDRPLLVINGDILTRVDFRAMLKFHQEQNAEMSIGVRQYEMKVPYGLVETEGTEVLKVTEKPTVNFLVNAGIYLLSPSVYRYIARDESLDMTDLIERLLNDGQRIVSFPILEYWLDIGQHDDYLKAQEDVWAGRL